MILHLVSHAEWAAAPDNQPYRPKSLDAQGFIHCTQGDELMLQVANAWYKDQPGDFLALEIDESRLTSAVKWEPPATPADAQQRGSVERPPEVKAEFGESPVPLLPDPFATTLFPHIYGPINRDAIASVRKFVRAEDGTFTGYASVEQVEPASPADADNPLNLKTPSQMAQELLDATDEFSESLKRFKDRVEGRMAEIDEKIAKL